jgi:DNA-directed RNA polymerase I, II, and III subunit RPABC2
MGTFRCPPPLLKFLLNFKIWGGGAWLLGLQIHNINIVFIYLKNKRYINHINRYVRLILNLKMENYLINFHPECVSHNYDEVIAMSKVIRDENGIIIDDFHRTIPFMTKFEKARILGQRAKQINSGATPFVKVPENVIDGYLIAELELKQKRIPFIIRRPLPNGGSEYWSIKDLEDISF